MGNLTQHPGLCSNCLNASVCTYPRAPEQPVLECDEYECPNAVPAATNADQCDKQTTSTAKTQEIEESGPGDRMGLCSSCDNRQTCAFPKPEGGVWHCEEYR